MKIVGICGHAGAGKDTLADGIIGMGIGEIGSQRHPYLRAEKAAIAEPLKQSLAKLFNIPRELLDERAFKSSQCRIAEHQDLRGLSWRDVMQRYGDMLRQAFGEEFLLCRLLAELKRMQRGGCDVAIVPDIRLPVEAKFLNVEARRLGCGCLIAEAWNESVKPANSHRTEMALPEGLIDLRIENKGSKREYQEAGACAVLRKLGLL